MHDEVKQKGRIEYYLELPYSVQLTRQIDDDAEYWVAEILDLPGCTSHGATPDEAVDNIEEAKRLWIQTHLEDGYEVPEPSDTCGYSGRLVVRMSKSLHRKLAIGAKREGVSLNQHIVSLLAEHSSSRSHMEALLALVERSMSPQLVADVSTPIV